MLTLAWAGCAQAGPDILVQGRLNYSRIQQAYLEADWNPLAKELKAFLRKPGALAERVDSIWALKYLGAIRGSRAETRLQSEEDFRRLLLLDPAFEASNLSDLFVSEEVLAVFRRMKTESRNARDPAFAQAPAPTPAAPEPQKRRSKTGLWVAAGVGTVAVAAVGATYYLRTRDRTREEVIHVPFPPAEGDP